MTTIDHQTDSEICPAEDIFRLLSGKWKLQIIRLSLNQPVRFNELLRQIEGSNKQSIATALKELTAEGVLNRIVVKRKPLHIEYILTEKGKLLVPFFKQLESI